MEEINERGEIEEKVVVESFDEMELDERVLEAINKSAGRLGRIKKPSKIGQGIVSS